MFSCCFTGRRFSAAMLALQHLLPAALLLMLLAAALVPGMPRPAHAADADSIIGAVDDAMRQADRARDAYDRVRSSGDRDAIFRHERDWRDAEYRLEDARIENLSRESGMSPSRIRSMRESGMGWGQVAKEAGAHPGSLGVGHSKGKKGGWNRDDDRDLSRDYYRDRRDRHDDDRRDGDRDGKEPRHGDRQAKGGRHDDDRQARDGRHDDTHAKGGKPGKGGKDKGEKGNGDYPYDDKAKGKGKK